MTSGYRIGQIIAVIIAPVVLPVLLVRSVIRRSKALLRPNDPLAGKFFLSIRRCASCGASQVDGKGKILSRVPEADAYILSPFALGTTGVQSASFVQRVQGHEISHWRLYDNAWMMNFEESELARLNHEHRQEPSEAVN